MSTWPKPKWDLHSTACPWNGQQRMSARALREARTTNKRHEYVVFCCRKAALEHTGRLTRSSRRQSRHKPHEIDGRDNSATWNIGKRCEQYTTRPHKKHTERTAEGAPDATSTRRRCQAMKWFAYVCFLTPTLRVRALVLFGLPHVWDLLRMEAHRPNAT